jgi:hypothetical protein
VGARSPSADIERRVRRLCLALPEATERTSHGSPAFFANKQFLHLWTDGHHEDRFAHLWCAAPPGAQEGLVAADPERYFRPPYVGGRGWIGVRLDRPIGDEELAGLIEDAYCAVAPARLIRALEADRGDAQSVGSRGPQPG